MAFATPRNNIIQLRLAAPYAIGSGSMTLASGQGINFGNFPVYFTVITAATYATGAAEVKVGYTATGVTGDILTGVSTISGYVDRNFAVGDFVEERVSVQYILDLNAAVTALQSGGGSGTVTDVTFTGDGVIFSTTPSAAVSTSGTVAPSTLSQFKNTALRGPASGSAALPSFRLDTLADLSGGINLPMIGLNVFVPQNYGATGNGSTDDTAAIQAALTAAGTNASAASPNAIVFLPSGNYLIGGQLNIPDGVTLRGTWACQWSMRSGVLPTTGGTTLLITGNAGSATATAAITLNQASCLDGITIYYPNQVTTNPPTAYPYAVNMVSNKQNARVQNCCLLNPYQGINIVGHGRGQVTDVIGQPLWSGIYVDQSFDITRLTRVHFWPMWSISTGVYAWQLVNGIAFNFFRSDEQSCTNLFAYGYAFGYAFSASASGATYGTFTACSADQCGIAINCVESSSGSGGVDFIGGGFALNTGIYVSMAAGTLNLIGCRFWTGDQSLVQSGGDMRVIGCRFAGSGVEIESSAGQLVFADNILNSGSTVALSGTVQANVAGNLYVGGIFSSILTNSSSGTVTVGGNNGDVVAAAAASQYFLDNFIATPGTFLDAHTANTAQVWSNFGTADYMEFGPSGEVWSNNSATSAGYRVACTPDPTDVIIFRFKYYGDLLASIGVYFNASASADSGYNVRYVSNGTGAHEFDWFTFTAGTPSNNHNVVPTLTANHIYEIVITPNGSGIYVCTYRDVTALGPDIALFTVTDTTYTSGLLGFRASGVMSASTGFHAMTISTLTIH